MKEADADIFSINKTHADKMNAKNNKVLKTSQRRMFQSKEGKYSNLVSSSSTAPITSYTKQWGHMIGITGTLIYCMRRRIEDKYGCWCGFVLLGKDNREIVVLTAYNVPQDIPTEDDTLHTQQTFLYLFDGKVNPNPRKLFICYLLTLITRATNENQGIILMGDFNQVVGDDPKMMAEVLSACKLVDVHVHNHGHVKIATCIRGRRQVDYCFVSARILNHVL